MQTISISELKPDRKNINKHTERSSKMVQTSLQKFGAGRSILIDKDNQIIAGNLTAEEAGQIGLENVQIVESDGTKLIAVKRTDISLDSPEGRGLALSDNRAADFFTPDIEILNELQLEGLELNDWYSEIELNSLFGYNLDDSLNEDAWADQETSNDTKAKKWTFVFTGEEFETIESAMRKVKSLVGDSLGNRMGALLHQICADYVGR